MDPLSLVTQLGLPAALCVFFVWRSDAREQRMAKSIEDKDRFIRDALIERDEERAKAMAEIGSAMTSQASAVNALVTEMRATRTDRNGGHGKVQT